KRKGRSLANAWQKFLASATSRRLTQRAGCCSRSGMCVQRRRRRLLLLTAGCCGLRERSRVWERSTRGISRTIRTRESSMQREGSALHGIGVVVLKELNDHLTSVRMRVLEWLVVLVGMLAVYFAVDRIRQVVAEDPFLFLRLFTTAPEVIPIAFLHILSILVPLIAIGLGFDAINSEHNRRTLSRILAQPIYRDALLFGKFAAGLLTITISLLALWLIVIGFGLLMLGVPPNAEEMARAFVFLLVTIAYAGVWLALAMLFSVVFRSPATAALVTFGVLVFFWLLC